MSTKTDLSANTTSANSDLGVGQRRGFDLPRSAVGLRGPCSKRGTVFGCCGNSLRAHSAVRHSEDSVKQQPPRTMRPPAASLEIYCSSIAATPAGKLSRRPSRARVSGETVSGCPWRTWWAPALCGADIRDHQDLPLGCIKLCRGVINKRHDSSQNGFARSNLCLTRVTPKSAKIPRCRTWNHGTHSRTVYVTKMCLAAFDPPEACTSFQGGISSKPYYPGKLVN
jgi:hypothetical protein